MLAIPGLRRHRQGDSRKFQVNLTYQMKPYLKRGKEGREEEIDRERERQKRERNREGCGVGSEGKMLYRNVNLTVASKHSCKS